MHYADYYSKLTMQQMVFFLEVAKHESITKAAETLHITHSAVSKGIMNLEYVLEINLFIRSKQRLKLTPAGKVLQAELTNIMLDLEKAIIQADLAQNVGTKPLIIGMPAGVDPSRYVIDSIENYRIKKPNFEFFVESYYFADMPKALTNGDIDVAFSFLCDVRSYSSYEFHQINSCPWIAHLHQSNPLCEKEELFLDDLRTLDFLFPYSIYGNTYADTLLEMCREHGFIPKASYYMYSNALATLNVQHKNVVLLTDDFALLNNPHSVVKPISNTKTGTIIACRKDEKSAVIKDFVQETVLYWTRR